MKSRRAVRRVVAGAVAGLLLVPVAGTAPASAGTGGLLGSTVAALTGTVGGTLGVVGGTVGALGGTVGSLLGPDGWLYDDTATELDAVAAVIGADPLHAAGVTGRGVGVALVDTGSVPVRGLDSTRNGDGVVNGPDLSFEGQSAEGRYLDTFGHGTHLAGIIAGDDPATLLGLGRFRGIAPDARLTSLKVASADGAVDVSQVIAAIDWVVVHRNGDPQHPIRVLNLSYGTDGVRDYRSDPLTHAVENAWRAGIVVVVAGGNSGTDAARLNDPAYDPYVLAVGASDTRGTVKASDDLVPAFSSRGDASRRVDLVAPGRSVVSLRDPGSFLDQAYPGARVGTRYFKGSGSSQAAAVASGAVVLMLQARPGLTPDQVKELLVSSAEAMPQADPAGRGRGELDVLAATLRPTPRVTQTWPRSTGLGSLESARGTQHVSDGDVALSGEQHVLGAWDAGRWASASSAFAGWTGGRWADVVELSLLPEFAGAELTWETSYDGSVTRPPAPSRTPHLAAWLGSGSLVAGRRTPDPALSAALRRARLRDAAAKQLQGELGIVGTLLVGNRLGESRRSSRPTCATCRPSATTSRSPCKNARRADRIREQAADALHRSLHDPLTGLPNRRRLEDALRALCVQAGHSLVLLNLDRFKEINDTLGHTAGDDLLTLVAARLRKTVPETATLARVGGDEFAVLLPDTDAEAAGEVAVLRHAFAMPFELDQLMVTVGASFGVTTTPGIAPIDVLRRADIAMSAAKERRTGVEAYRSELDAGSRERLTILTELRRAISDGSLAIWVQPKVNLVDGQVTGVEALVRWEHPERGTIYPDDFIPVAEQSGLITPLTMTVLRQSLQACEAWRRGGRCLSVAVNLSPRSLLEADFVDEVARALAAVDVPPSAVTFEITESSLMADPERAISALRRLRDLGVRLSIDDLGTGYSSLAYLQRLPVDEIKIDRSFLQRADVAGGGDSVAIIGAIVDLGHRLGREFVAEGVEDEASWRTLQSLGCDSAQGYWMSRPVPEPEFLPWLDRWMPVNVPALRAV